MFDRYEAGEQAVLVHIYFSQDKDTEDLSEFESLVSSAGVEALQVVTGSRKAPHPKYFVGEGKAEEIADAVKASGASVVLFDHSLSPAQERNLERLCECRVIDRTGLILDIFAQRARTHEGKLQVELAHEVDLFFPYDVTVDFAGRMYVTLSEARSRLYQHRFLQPNTYFAAFF